MFQNPKDEELTMKQIEEIKQNIDKVDWYLLSCHKYLSEDFIREFADKVNWVYICYYQNLSEEFIIEFYDKVHWRTLWDRPLWGRKNLIENIFEKLDEEKKLYLLMNWKWVYDQIK